MRIVTLTLALACSLAGCSDRSDPPVDAGTDAPMLDAAMHDAGVDAGPDASVDPGCPLLERPGTLLRPPAEGRLPCDLQPPVLR